ncbi:MAG: M48 family metalloprotease [bacterium]|nr:M48 family metalloprotease [bacterium]
MSRFIILITLVLTNLIPLPHAAHAADLPWAEQYRDRHLTLRPSINQNPVVYSCADGVCVTMVCQGDLFPLLAPERVVIDGVKIKDDGKRLELHLRSEHLGKGKLRIERERDAESPLDRTTVARLIELLSADGNVNLCAARTDGDVLHYTGSNHCPAPGLRREYADTTDGLAAGLRLCPACFSAIHRIPDYREEVSLGESVASQIRTQYMVVPDDEHQVRVQMLGERVLAQWPFELRGYNYRFTLIDSDDANAVACPGGWLFINNALIDLCETERELETVLAHEIAHVEMRHGIRQLRKAKRNAMIGGIFAGVFAAAVAGEGEGAQMAGAIASIMISVAMEISLMGYSADFEREADAYAINYLAHNYEPGARREYVNLMRKLRYMKECVSRERYRVSEFSTHPDLESRVDFANDARIEFFDPQPVFPYDKNGELALELRVSGITEHSYRRVEVIQLRSRTSEIIREGSELRMFVSLKSTNALGEPMELKHMHFRLGEDWYKIDNKEDTLIYPSHSVSVCLIREGGDPLDKESLLPEEIKLSNGDSRHRTYRDRMSRE